MQLRELLSVLGENQCFGNEDIRIESITDDSRLVTKGDLFIAVAGSKADGNKYITEAIQRGAVAICSQNLPIEDWQNLGVQAWIKVDYARKALSRIAAVWYRFPGDDLKIVGVTGTNGKTTTTWLVHHIMKRAWHRAGLIGTIVIDDGEEVAPALQTTPGALEMQHLLSEMANHSCRGLAMEVSSHALDQNRVEDVPFDVAVFTNLTRDHLDYHETMEKYFAAKMHLFELAKEAQKRGKKPAALINIDDPYGKKLVEEMSFGGNLKIVTYGYSAEADLKVSTHHVALAGCEYQLEWKGKSYLVRTSLTGRFNVMNTAAAIGASVLAGVKIREAIAALSDAPQVPGRLEMVGNRFKIQVVVDYAHTPDAIQNAAQVLKDFNQGRLITIFGCGGDRDKGKRPQMGAMAAKFSDICVVTSDNPRNEVPADIIKDIVAGMNGGKYSVIEDREEAIRVGIELARPGDIVLIAGKGHEDYQEVNGKKHYFSDRDVARKVLSSLQENDYNKRKF